MEQNIKDTVVERVKEPLAQYSDSFRELLEIGRKIDMTLEKDTELLSDIRKKFDNLSAAVELEFEGTAVFDQEIKKTRTLLEQSINRVNDSITISGRITEDLDNISRSFDKIHQDGLQLDDIIKNISIVSDSIEVASRNAGITAFHAGRQGRGFEVIAREMTSLVRNVQVPTRAIPEVAEQIIKQVVSLGHDLLKISNLMHDLRKINGKFSDITDELLLLIPTVESGIKGIAESVESQKALHKLLLTENEKSALWLSEIYDIARSSTILEISLEAIFRRVNNLRENLVDVEDISSFCHIFNSLRIALEDAAKSYTAPIHDLLSQDISKFDVQSSDRSILQLVSESNQLFQIIKEIGGELKNWLKTNSEACDVLSKGLVFYQDVIHILSGLNSRLSSLKTKAAEIEKPLHELQRITERSRVLGLYAGIESARAGEYGSSLSVVTKEIQTLSEKSTSFVSKIGEVANDMSKNFSRLASYLVKSMSDVEQGVVSLKTGLEILDKNKKVLENLDHLSQEMVTSTQNMKTDCSTLSEQIRELNQGYNEINRNFKEYFKTIKLGKEAAEAVLDVVNQYKKEVNILKRRYKTVIFRQSIEPIILDPANKTDTRSHEVIEQIFTGLLTFDSSNHLMLGIAESFSVSKDGRVWDFTVKDNAKFHDGRPVTAAHIARSIERVKEGPNVSFVDYMEDIKVIDEKHLTFHLKFPYLPFLANLACGACDIVPDDFSPDIPIGAGPYRFVDWVKDKELILDAFDEFFDGRPPIDRVVIKIIPDNKEAVERFKKGEISLMQLAPDTFKEFDPAEVITGSILSTQYIGINVMKETPFKNKKVRQAMNYAINKELFAKEAMEGQAVAAYGVFPPGMTSVYNISLVGYRYNLDKAKALMEEAGYGGGLDGSFPFDISDSKLAVKRALYIKECLEKIGIKLIINPMSWKDFLERGYRGDSILCMKSWVSDNGDPDNFLYPLFHSKSFGRAGNTSFYENKKVDEMIDCARAERNTKRRCRMYQEVEQIIVEDAPWIFLSHGVDSFVVKKNIGGFKVDPFNIVRFRYLWSE